MWGAQEKSEGHYRYATEHVIIFFSSITLSLVQEFGTISQPHSDKLFLPLLSKDN